MSLESINKIAELTGFDRRTVKNRLKSISPVIEGRASKYETTEVLVFLYNAKEDPNVEIINGMEPLDYERWRKTKAEATSLEMKNQMTRREIAPVELLELAIAVFAEQACSVFESIPIKVKRRMPHLKASEIDIIKREIIKIQNAASKIQIDWTQLKGLDK